MHHTWKAYLMDYNLVICFNLSVSPFMYLRGKFEENESTFGPDYRGGFLLSLGTLEKSQRNYLTLNTKKDSNMWNEGIFERSARGKTGQRLCTCAISHVHAAAVIFQLLVDFVQYFFAENCMKWCLQRFIDIYIQVTFHKYFGLQCTVYIYIYTYR